MRERRVRRGRADGQERQACAQEAQGSIGPSIVIWPGMTLKSELTLHIQPASTEIPTAANRQPPNCVAGDSIAVGCVHLYRLPEDKSGLLHSVIFLMVSASYIRVY